MRVGKPPAVLLELLVLITISGSAWAQKVPEGPILVKGALLGDVRFDHAAHLKVAAKCEVCHHVSKPQKPAKAPQEACTGCHTKPPTPEVATGLQAAFHNSTATAGLCIDCHKQQNATGKAAPTKCADCHQKANG